jgi:hypothetical protein
VTVCLSDVGLEARYEVLTLSEQFRRADVSGVRECGVFLGEHRLGEVAFGL